MVQETENTTRIDYGIILCIMLLAIIGITSLYSTTVLIHDSSIRMTIMQIIWYVIGASAAGIVMLFDSEQLWKMTDYLYWAAIVLLIFTLLFYDRQLAAQAGARRWVRIPGINFLIQPSEFVKIPYILKLAKTTRIHNEKYQNRTIQSDLLLLVQLISWSILPLALVISQPDLGTTLVFIAILSGVLLLSGVQWKILLPLLFTGVIIGIVMVYLVVYNREFLKQYLGLHDYQFLRVDSWLDPYHDISATSYQVTQGFKAIGSGGMFGKGLGVSEVFVPVRESDMIFATIGENFGFAGISFLVFTYLILIYHMITIIFDVKNEFYTYIAAGIIMMIAFHVFANIGMNIGLLPVTGIPLPFVSQGGSALLGNMMAIGLMLSMRFHHRTYMFSDENDDFI